MGWAVWRMAVLAVKLVCSAASPKESELRIRAAGRARGSAAGGTAARRGMLRATGGRGAGGARADTDAGTGKGAKGCN